MLYQPADAEDATQEILIKILTRLDRFRQASSFETWALKIASNHLCFLWALLYGMSYVYRYEKR